LVAEEQPAQKRVIEAEGQLQTEQAKLDTLKTDSWTPIPLTLDNIS
jgi:hypothetical protein